MNFSKENNKSIIDEIYESKKQQYELYVDTENKENRNCSIINEKLDKIENCCKKDVPEKTKETIKKYCDELDRACANELDFWQKKFYKLGFIDGLRMAEDIKMDTKFEE